MSARHVAVVLAAGGSRRLGRPKQLLTRAGEPLLCRAARLALATAPVRVLVIVGAGHAAMAAALHESPVETLLNPDWEQGLSTSLRVAADALATAAGSCLILGCDQPALERSHLEALLALAHGPASGCAATVHGDLAGIPAVVPMTLLRQAAALHGDQGLRGVLRALPEAELGRLEASELRFDIDTPEQLRAAVGAGWVDPVDPVEPAR
ncbi:nucleotidyltransferase family protein [Luteimonas salinilitoris]|uniref:NTP transferase domain-containing protein n=1 Tax=Luteimonas salinilitoris TaxID=3237697 RepID=A0ABV4HWE6_9GAMM